MTVALVGVESGREEFRDQKSLLDDLAKPYQTLESLLGTKFGLTSSARLRICLPQSTWSVSSLSTNQLDLALSLAQVKISDVHGNGTKFYHLWEMS